MDPLLALAAGLLPDLMRLIAGDNAGALSASIVKAVTDVTGAKTAVEAKKAIDGDPKVATDLQVKLAAIALDARRAELADQQQRDELASKATERAQALQLQLTGPAALAPMIISYTVVLGFFGVVILVLVGFGPSSENQLVNICIGTMASAFATVMNFWLGSSLGSRNKDSTIAAVARSGTKDSDRPAESQPRPDVGNKPPRPPTTLAGALSAQAPADQPPVAGHVSAVPSADTVSVAGPIKALSGRMSYFGGPNDHDVGPDEPLALISARDIAHFAPYFLAQQPPGTTGLARRLNPEASYIACRWDYHETPPAFLRGIKVEVTNPRTGAKALAQPVDWGPSADLHRIADLSPGLARRLGLDTDDECHVAIPLPAPMPTLDAGRIETSHPTVLTLVRIKAAFGDFTYGEAAGGRITIDPSWVASSIIEVIIPELAAVHSGPVPCHRAIAPALLDAFAEVGRRGLTNRILAWDGSFVPRHKGWNPARNLSAHSWGIAFDINARWNPYGGEPAPKGAPGSVVELVPIFEAHGFAWGGYFSAKYRDGMHFEYCRAP